MQWVNKYMSVEQTAKNLYKFSSNIMGSQKENPLPDSNSPEIIAEEFAEYFITKIQKIWDALKTNHYMNQLQM